MTMFRQLLRLTVITVVALRLAPPATAHAQAAERAATAEDLFRQGLQLTKQGRFDDACPKFAESHRLDPAFGALMNLAACYEKTGRTASAWQAYVDATELARDKGQRARADSARKKAGQLAPRLVRLELRLGAGVEASGLEITRNGKPFDLALLGNAVPVDPGNQVIVASRAGASPWKTSVNATEPGKTRIVELIGPTAAPVAPPRATPGATIDKTAPVASPDTAAKLPPAPLPDRSRRAPMSPVATDSHEPDAVDGGRRLRIAGITLAAGGAALAATGSVFAWLSRSISDDYTHVEMGERFDPDREHRARTYQVSAFVLWGAGAVAIAGGVTAYVLGRRTDETRLRVAPVPLRGGAAAQVTWQW